MVTIVYHTTVCITSEVLSQFSSAIANNLTSTFQNHWVCHNGHNGLVQWPFHSPVLILWISTCGAHLKLRFIMKRRTQDVQHAVVAMRTTPEGYNAKF
jgi:hypothetical protein